MTMKMGRGGAAATEPRSHGAPEPRSHGATKPRSHGATEPPSQGATGHGAIGEYETTVLIMCAPWNNRERQASGECSTTEYRLPWIVSMLLLYTHMYWHDVNISALDGNYMFI